MRIGTALVQNQDRMCRACAHDDSLALVCHERQSEYLRQIYLFRDLTEQQVAAAAETLKTEQIEDGRWIYRQGDPVARFFIVREGQVALFRQSPGGKEIIIALVGEDEMFAEDLLFLEAARHDVNARAVGDCTLLSFDRIHVRSFLDESPQLCLRLMETLYRRKQMLLDEIERLTLQNATERVMTYLLGQAAGVPAPQRLRLSIPKAVLASRLSIQPETLSRILARLKECNYLVEEDGALVIPRPDELRAGLQCSICSLRSWGCPGPEYESVFPEADQSVGVRLAVDSGS